jgi:hypothetical protein
MLKFLWSHTRNINVEVFQHKAIYSIPIYGDLIFKNYKVVYDEHCQMLKLTTYLEPIPHHLEESLLHTVKTEKVLPDENDKYSESYPLVCHKMK